MTICHNLEIKPCLPKNFTMAEAVPVELDDYTFIQLALAAHEADKKLNDFIVELITRCIEETEDGKNKKWLTTTVTK